MITKWKSIFNEASRFGNTVYYRIFNPDKQDPSFRTYLTGDTYDIRKTLFDNGFKWDNIERAWVNKGEVLKKNNLEKFLIPIFKKIEKLNYSISPDPHNEITIGNYKKSKVPEIPNGNGKKIIIKQSSHYAPQTIIKGGGTKLAKDLLRYYGFDYQSMYHVWQAWAFPKEKQEELLNILKANNYTIEFEGDPESIDVFVKKVKSLNGKNIRFDIYKVEGNTIYDQMNTKEGYSTCKFNIDNKGIYFKNVNYSDLKEKIKIDFIPFENIKESRIFTKKGTTTFRVNFNINDKEYQLRFEKID